MAVFDSILIGFATLFTVTNVLILTLGCLLGTLVGSLPGIGPINGVAILLPISYSLGLPLDSILILLAAVYNGSEFGGRISSIILNVPGDAGAIITTLDGYPMSQNGDTGKALSLSAFASFFGSLVACVFIMFLAPFINQIAFKFGPSQYVMLMVLALTCLTTLVGKSPLKTFMSLLIGLMIATVGIDPTTGIYRYTFNSAYLFEGIDFLIVVIGIFAFSEFFMLLEQRLKQTDHLLDYKHLHRLISFKEIMRVRWTIIRGSLIGFFIGILPGTGASIASAVSYGLEKKIHKDEPDACFGQGDQRGLAAPESANNAAAIGSMAPLLTLGIPGSGTTAILLGALLLFNITPGPTLMAEQPELVWGLLTSLLVGSFILLVINYPLISFFVWVLRMPLHYLIVAILVITCLGVYSIHGSTFDLWLAFFLGSFAFILRRLSFEMAPLILGVVLGHLFEDNFRRAMQLSDGSFTIFVDNSINLGLLFFSIIVIIAPFLLKKFKSF